MSSFIAGPELNCSDRRCHRCVVHVPLSSTKFVLVLILILLISLFDVLLDVLTLADAVLPFGSSLEIEQSMDDDDKSGSPAHPPLLSLPTPLPSRPSPLLSLAIVVDDRTRTSRSDQIFGIAVDTLHLSSTSSDDNHRHDGLGR